MQNTIDQINAALAANDAAIVQFVCETEYAARPMNSFHVALRTYSRRDGSNAVETKSIAGWIADLGSFSPIVVACKTKDKTKDGAFNMIFGVKGKTVGILGTIREALVRSEEDTATIAKRVETKPKVGKVETAAKPPAKPVEAAPSDSDDSRASFLALDRESLHRACQALGRKVHGNAKADTMRHDLLVAVALDQLSFHAVVEAGAEPVETPAEIVSDESLIIDDLPSQNAAAIAQLGKGLADILAHLTNA